MAEALAAVKRDLGANAVILNTRSYRRGGLFGLGRRTVIEVTATAGDRAQVAARQRAASRTRSSGNVAAARAYGKAPASERADDAENGPSELERQKTRRLAQAMLEQHERRLRVASAANDATMAEPPSEPRAVAQTTESASAVRTIADAPKPAAPDPAPSSPTAVARRFILTPTSADAGHSAPDESAAAHLKEPVATSASDGDCDPAPSASGAIAAPPKARTIAIYGEDGTDFVSDEPSREAQLMRDELSAIRSMVGHVLQQQVSVRGAPTPTMPKQLFEMYLRLVGQDVSEELADRIVNDVRDELGTAELEDPERVQEAVTRHLADYIPTCEQAVLSESVDGRPLTIALIGPTGVGKTTTLAKLAASFKLRHQKRVGLITADTYRIAAVDQLRTYANIIGLPLEVVLTPSEMHKAVQTLSECDVILIDTAGRSQNDAGRLDELKQFLEAADPHEVHLVLSSTAGERVLLREAEAFCGIGADKVVLTKLDEAVSFGMLINVVRQIGKQLSFYTTGQEVPDHIEVSQPDRLAELIMGGELKR
jgi:flagellar biosynthesis protein FlhF